MSMTTHLTVQDWAALISAALTAVGVLAVFITIRQSVRTSRSEKFADTYIYFSEKSAKLFSLNRALKDKFSQGDKSVTEGEVYAYAGEYWWFNYQQWQFYQASLVSATLYSSWVLLLHEHITSDRGRGFFDANGQAKTLSPYEAFQTYAYENLKFCPEFLEFVEALRKIPRPDIYGPAIQKAIRKLVNRRTSGTYWRF